MSAVKVEATSFARAVGNASLFAGKDGLLPALCAVNIEYDGTNVYCVATDRYQLGVDTSATVTDNGEPFALLLDASEVKRLVAHVTANLPKNMATGMSVTVTPDGDRLLVVTWDGNVATFRDVTGEFPRWRMLMPATAETKPTERVGLNPSMLAKFAKVKTERKNPTALVRFYGELKPVRFDIGDTFSAIQMPVRIDWPVESATTAA